LLRAEPELAILHQNGDEGHQQQHQRDHQLARLLALSSHPRLRGDYLSSLAHFQHFVR
jgi:hypothetical protein